MGLDVTPATNPLCHFRQIAAAPWAHFVPVPNRRWGGGPMDKLLTAVGKALGMRSSWGPGGLQDARLQAGAKPESWLHSEEVTVSFPLACGLCPAPAGVWECRGAGQEVKSGSPAHPASPLHHPRSQAHSACL